MNQKLLCITNLPVVTLNTLQKGHFRQPPMAHFLGECSGCKADEHSMQGLRVAPGEDVAHDLHR